MPTPTGIAETALYVDQLDRAADFYVDLFGCETLRRDDRFCALRVRDGQVLLLFRRGASLTPVPLDGGTVPAHDGDGPLHVCFGVRAGELDLWEQHLQRRNIEVESRVIWSENAASLYFRDPDGHAVELAEPSLWD